MIACTATVHAVGNKAGTETPSKIQNVIFNMHIDLDAVAIFTKTYPTRQISPAARWVRELAVCVIRVVFWTPQAGHSTRQGFGPRFDGAVFQTKLFKCLISQLFSKWFALTCWYECGLQRWLLLLLLWLLLWQLLMCWHWLCNHNTCWSGRRRRYCHIVWRRCLNGPSWRSLLTCRQRCAGRIKVHLWIQHSTLLFHGLERSMNQVLYWIQ